MKRIWAGILGAALVLGLLMTALGLSGDPLSRFWAEKRAIVFAEELYPGQEFFVQAVTRDRPFSYRVEVQSQTSVDTRFSVTTDFWVRTSDEDSRGNADHVRLVEEKWNTRRRLGEETAKRAAAILLVELPEIQFSPLYGIDEETVFVDLCAMEEEWERCRQELSVDMAFEPELFEKMTVCMSAVALWQENPTAEDLQETLIRIRTAMEKHGMMFDYYEISLIRSDGEGEAFSSGMIASEKIGE